MSPVGPTTLEIITAEYRTSRGQFRIGGNVGPISWMGKANMVTVSIDGQTIGTAFPDVTGAWEVRATRLGTNPSVPNALSIVEVKSQSNLATSRQLVIRN